MAAQAPRDRHGRAAGKIVEAPFTPAADRRSALDRAHRGDIVGALGRVGSHDTAPRRGWRRRLTALLAVMGPGVVVMVADNDAGGVSVYAQAGEDHGFFLLWLVVALVPVLYLIQEMAARLGAVTGAGHARLIFERFGRRWGFFALSDLLVLNLLTLITDFIGISLALDYLGLTRLVAVPVAALALIAVGSLGSFRRWERAMFVLIALSLVFVPVAVLAGLHHPPTQGLAGRQAGPLPGLALMVVAIAGTTVAPWQLFLQQSNVVDKRITPRWLPYERVDLAIGTALFAFGAVAVLVAAASVGEGGNGGAFVDAGRIAAGMGQSLGPWAGALFAVALFDGSLLGAAAVTLATAYALGDVFGTRHSLHRRWRDAPLFHGSFALTLVLAATVVLTPGVPLGLVILGVQALAGVLLPSATVLLLLLCNDRTVLGPWVNPRWLNLVAVLVIAALLEVSALLTLTLLDPQVAVLPAGLALAVLLGLGVAIYLLLHARSRRSAPFAGTPWERATWSMPALESLPPPARSAARTVGLTVLRIYLFSAGTLVVVKIAASILGH
ncbi:MAG TPA: Nramp family divalent metal transporter [Candidatus Dormibacteraeota bacterium]